MASRVRHRTRFFPAIGALSAAIASLALLAPGVAGAATVVNGDFESGTLNGWQLQNSSPWGSWYAYSGTKSPQNPGIQPPVPAPPAGNFAAITDQNNPGSHILYQDIAVEPGNTQQLTMLLYYDSEGPLETPEPSTLSTEVIGVPNQQYRVDLVRPSAPIESVDAADILAPIFGTKTGDPEIQAPFTRTIDLAPFAGQTVRLRFAEADNGGPLRAGVDSIAVLGAPPPGPPVLLPPSNAIVVGKLTRNLNKGTAKLKVTVPGPGVLVATDARKKGKKLRKATVRPGAAGTIAIPLIANGAGLKILRERNKLPVKVALAFTPTGGAAGQVFVKRALKLKPQD